jgi:hypothetical protein
MRIITTLIALGVLAACSPRVPDSGAGIGFGDSQTQAERARRDAALSTGQPLFVPPSVISDETLTPAPLVTGTALPAAAPVATVAGTSSSAVSGTLPSAVASADPSNADIATEAAAALQASPSNPAPLPLSSPGLSDENNFAAVAGRESIESDAARIATNRAQYEVVQPTVLPPRSTSAQPNIVNYALSTTNPRGQRIYSRTGLNLVSRSMKACAKYPSPDQAQIAFLDAGGPERDRKALDPDGDGYACTWDPTPFRRAVSN